MSENTKDTNDIQEKPIAEEATQPAAEEAAQPSAEAAEKEAAAPAEKPEEETVEICALEPGQKLTRAQRDAWEEKANDIIEKIRPYIQHDGGDVELLGVDEDGIAYVTFLGACAGCMMAGEDFSTGIRLLLLDEFPELKEVMLVG